MSVIGGSPLHGSSRTSRTHGFADGYFNLECWLVFKEKQKSRELATYCGLSVSALPFKRRTTTHFAVCGPAAARVLAHVEDARPGDLAQDLVIITVIILMI